MVILVGTSEPPTENDKAKALTPTIHFQNALKKIASRTTAKSPSFTKIKKRPDDTRSWQHAVTEMLREIEKEEVIFNVTSGTRSMMFGAMLGLETARTSHSWSAVIYLSNPARTEQLRPVPIQSPNYLASVDPLTLEELLSLRGYEWRYSRQSDKHRARMLERKDFTRWMVGKMTRKAYSGAYNTRPRVLHAVIGEVEDREGKGKTEAGKRSFSPDKFSDDRHNKYKNGKGEPHGSGLFWKDDVFLNRDAPPHNNLYRKDSGKIELQGKQAIDYFTGGWFEEYVFLLCRDILGCRSDLQLYVKVRYADPETAGGKEDGEIDLIIKVANDLHLIECKAGRVASRSNPDGINRSTIHTISTRRRQISAGGSGSGRVVSFQTGYSDFQVALEREAKSAQVAIYFGKRGAKDFKTWLRSLC